MVRFQGVGGRDFVQLCFHFTEGGVLYCGRVRCCRGDRDCTSGPGPQAPCYRVSFGEYNVGVGACGYIVRGGVGCIVVLYSRV